MFHAHDVPKKHTVLFMITVAKVVNNRDVTHQIRISGQDYVSFCISSNGKRFVNNGFLSIASCVFSVTASDLLVF